MRIKTRPDDVSMAQMNDWLAELRDEDRAEPTRDDAAQPEAPVAASPTAPGAVAATAPATAAATAPAAAAATAPAATAASESAASAEAGTSVRVSAPAAAEAPAHAGTPVETGGPAHVSTPAGPPRVGTPARPSLHARAGIPADVSPDDSASVRPVIGDQIRMPIMWCEMGSCISWYTHHAALGEADTRARAIADGWRIDALGRLTCPECQQTDPRFWASCAVVPWDRFTAIARTARITAVRSDGIRGRVPEISHDRSRRVSGDPGRAASGHLGTSGHLATSSAESVWLRSYAAARAM